MKIPAWMLTIVLMIVGGISGVVIAFNTFPEPEWHRLVVPSKQKDLSEILFVDHKDFDKTENDILYVKTKSNSVYSIQHNEWNLLPTLPNGETINKIGFNIGDTDSPIIATTNKNQFYQLGNTSWKLIPEYQEFHWSNEFDQCAITKEWRHTPPIEAGVIDSKGFVFEHTISGFFKCYVLYKDGHLEIWSHTASSLQSMGIAQTNCLVGIISGCVLSSILWFYNRLRSKKESL